MQAPSVDRYNISGPGTVPFAGEAVLHRVISGPGTIPFAGEACLLRVIGVFKFVALGRKPLSIKIVNCGSL